MKTFLPLCFAACCSVVGHASTAPVPSFQEKAIGHPPLSLNELARQAASSKSFEFPARVPRFTDGIGPDNPVLRDLQPAPSAPPEATVTPAPAVTRRFPNPHGSRMPVITPSESVDYKMLIVPPDPNIDFKMRTIETGTPETPPQKK